jgi:transcriptional regulator with XRE-family HTH domain
MIISENISQIRQERGLTQRQLAEMMKSSSMNLQIQKTHNEIIDTFEVNYQN